MAPKKVSNAAAVARKKIEEAQLLASQGGASPTFRASTSASSAATPSVATTTSLAAAPALTRSSSMIGSPLPRMDSFFSRPGVSGVSSTLVPQADASFAELIRAREHQQQKLREDLEIQNRQLKERLGLIAGSLGRGSAKRDISHGGGGGGDAGGAGDDWSPCIDDKSPLLKSGSVVEEGSDEAHNDHISGASQHQLMEIIEFVTEMKETFRRAQEADSISLRVLQEQVELQGKTYEDRISVLEARLAAEQRARDILREEHAEQFEALMTSVDELRQTASQHLHERCSELEQSLANHSLSIQTLNLNTSASDERVEALETSLSSNQRVTTTLEIELKNLTDIVERDRSMLATFKDENIYKQKDHLDQVLRNANTQLEFIEKQLSKLKESSQGIQDEMEALISQRLSSIEDTLRDTVTGSLETAEQRIASEHQTTRRNLAKIEEELASYAEETQQRIADSLTSLQERYRGEVDRKITEVVERAKELEEVRRAEFPVADGDRVNLMIQELEGAAALIEGISKNIQLPHAGPRPCPLTKRVEKLEAAAEDWAVLLKDSRDAKIMFSVDCQAGPLSHDFNDQRSAEMSLKDRVERHLQSELDMAAADVSTRRTRAQTAVSVVQMAAHNTNNNSSFSSSRQNSPRQHNSQSEMMSAPPIPTSRKEALDAIIEERKQKEVAAQRVQDILREIQAKFQELSVREPLQRNMTALNPNAHGHTAGGSPNQRKLTELIAKQKEQIFQKERLLVEQRNRLWRDIAELEAQEETLLAAA